jgi:uncharacterized protein affecting Mg2+/Co2+ transport
MDKLSMISGALFFAADLFAIASLSMPYWIVTNVAGKTMTVKNNSVNGEKPLLICLDY